MTTNFDFDFAARYRLLYRQADVGKKGNGNKGNGKGETEKPKRKKGNLSELIKNKLMIIPARTCIHVNVVEPPHVAFLYGDLSIPRSSVTRS